MVSTWSVPDEAVRPPRLPSAPVSGRMTAIHAPMCFGCGNDNDAGMHVRVHVCPEPITQWDTIAYLDLPERFQGGPNVAHGGVIAAAIDEALGTTCELFAQTVVTGHLETDYLAPVQIGQTVTIRSRVVGQVRRKLYLEAGVYAEKSDDTDDDALLVRGQGLFVAIDAYAHFSRFL